MITDRDTNVIFEDNLGGARLGLRSQPRCLLLWMRLPIELHVLSVFLNLALQRGLLLGRGLSVSIQEALASRVASCYLTRNKPCYPTLGSLHPPQLLQVNSGVYRCVIVPLLIGSGYGHFKLWRHVRRQLHLVQDHGLPDDVIVAWEVVHLSGYSVLVIN